MQINLITNVLLTFGTSLLPGSAQVGQGGDKGGGSAGPARRKGEGVQGLRWIRAVRWGASAERGPHEWAQGESGAIACDRGGDCSAVATLLTAPSGGPAPPPLPRWPCAPPPLHPAPPGLSATRQQGRAAWPAPSHHP